MLASDVLLPRLWADSSRMLGWTLTFLLFAVVAAWLGFFGLAGLAAGIAKILLIVFVVLLIVSAFSGALRGRPPPV